MIKSLDPKWHPLFKAVVAQHKLDLEHSGHGPHHWFRVINNGLRLASMDSEIDPDVVIAFGLLHDSARTHDEHCLKHGPESARVINELRDLIPIDNEQLLWLMIACQNHTSASVDDFPIFDHTIRACMDADRLDLWRVGILPNNKYLFLDISKSDEIQEWANDNAENWTIPSWGVELLDQVEL